MKLTDLPPGPMREAAERQLGQKDRAADPVAAVLPETGTVTLPWPPSLNNMYPTSRSGHRYTSAKGKEFKAKAQSVLTAACLPLLDGPVCLTLRMYRPTAAGDLSNRIKAVEDVLTGFAWHDDKQVDELHVWRTIDRKNPRVEVVISPVDCAKISGPEGAETPAGPEQVSLLGGRHV